MLARSLLFMHPRPGRREDLVATFDRPATNVMMRTRRCHRLMVETCICSVSRSAF